MDHYIIYFINGESAHEGSIDIKHISNLLLATYKFDQHSKYYVPFLSHYAHAYIGIINRNIKEHQDVKWKEIIVENAHDQISSCLKSLSCSTETESICIDLLTLSKQIDILADQLPLHGTYNLDVIFNYDLLNKLPFEDNLELASSLYRLNVWHAAHFAVISCDEFIKSNIIDWIDLLVPEIVENCSESCNSSVLWRGGVQFKYSGISSNYTGYELRFNLDSTGSENQNMKNELLNKKSQCLVFSSTLSIMDICNFNSIPRYMIHLLPFTLCDSKCRTSSEISHEFYKFLHCNSGAALIARLHYSFLDDKPKSSKSFSTSKWKKAIDSNNFKIPEFDLPHFKQYMTFAITRCSTTDRIVAYPFVDPAALCPGFYFNMIDWCNIKAKGIHRVDEHTNHEDIKLPIALKSSIVTEYDNKDKSLLDFSTESCTIPLKESQINIIYEEIDPCDWPERICLLQKQIESEEQKSSQTRVMMNLSPQQHVRNVDFACEDVLKCFNPSGKAKDINEVEPLEIVCTALSTKTEFSSMLKENWPNILNCSYDDIYYNANNESEEKESIGNKMANTYVKYETASTCNKQQLCPSFSNLKSNHLTPMKIWKNLASKKPNLSDHKNKNNILKPSRSYESPTKSKSTESLSKTKEVKEREHSRKNLQPSRCSPRRKKLVNYASMSKTRRSLNFTENKSGHQDLAEILKKKLRVAVATALEKYGIYLNDAFFRPCGKKLFAICQTFLQDIPKTGSMSQHMQKIADAHVKQVIEFEKQKKS